jgi:hypothetical protein
MQANGQEERDGTENVSATLVLSISDVRPSYPSILFDFAFRMTHKSKAAYSGSSLEVKTAPFSQRHHNGCYGLQNWLNFFRIAERGPNIFADRKKSVN